MLVSVLDRGVGFPEEKKELIFERFYQVEDAMHHPTRGMGLGLYIAREIVEAHGGASGTNHARAAAPLSASPSPDVRLGSCAISPESCDQSLVDSNPANHRLFSFPAGVGPSPLGGPASCLHSSVEGRKAVSRRSTSSTVSSHICGRKYRSCKSCCIIKTPYVPIVLQ
ncbi:MAG: sensor histidine kinase, partial [Actinomycetota bacterium]